MPSVGAADTSFKLNDIIAINENRVARLGSCGHLVGLFVDHFGFERTLNLAVIGADVGGGPLINHFGFG